MLLPGTPKWEESVRIGREKCAVATAADADRNWFLGDVALDIAPMSELNVRNGAFSVLRQYAAEVGRSFQHVRKCRLVASKFEPSQRRLGIAWSVYEILMGYPELVAEGMTPGKARAALSQSRTMPVPTTRSPIHIVLDPDEMMNDSCMNTTVVVRKSVVDLFDQIIDKGPSPAEVQRIKDKLEAYAQRFANI